MSDNEVNGRNAKVLRDGKCKNVEWLSVQVGEIVRLDNNDQVPVSSTEVWTITKMYKCKLYKYISLIGSETSYNH